MESRLEAYRFATNMDELALGIQYHLSRRELSDAQKLAVAFRKQMDAYDIAMKKSYLQMRPREAAKLSSYVQRAILDAGRHLAQVEDGNPAGGRGIVEDSVRFMLYAEQLS